MPKRRAEGNVPEPSWDEQPVPAEPQPQPNAIQPQPAPENWNLAPLGGGGVLEVVESDTVGDGGDQGL